MISARHLVKRYGPTVVLEDVSLEVPGGQCLALLGPNGAGKTTLLRLLATLLRPSSGHLAIGGVDAIREPDRVREHIAVVGHGSYLYEDLTALENLRFWTALAGGDSRADRLRGALGRVELDGVADDRVRTFSAGMRRRLSLARVLLGDARLLLLDEPFTGLDQQGRKWLGEFLLGFKASGRTAVMATHSFASGLAAADRIAILGGGRLLVDQPCADLSWQEVHRLYVSLTDSGGAAA